MKESKDKIIKKSKLEYFSCNLCGGDDLKTLSKKDRYGLPVRTVICKNCGLVFINPRMSNGGYENFYRDHYRNLIRNLKKKEVGLENIFASGQKFGDKLNAILGEYIKPGLAIEVGSSCGGVLDRLKQITPGLEVIGIEISAEEASYANRLGIKTIISSMEELRKDVPSAENIITARSLNHLLNPSYFFSWAYKNLKKDGRLIAVVLNFPAFCEKRRKLITQIDHPFMFTPEILNAYYGKYGFITEIILKDGDYIFAVGKKEGVKKDGYVPENKARYEKTKKELSPIRLWFKNLVGRIL